jgi:RNA polymerase primary sigma factor
MDLPRQPVPTATEEAALARRVKLGDRGAKEEMVLRNLGLVWSVAMCYRGFGVPIEDVVQEGTVGLVRAIDRFDPRRGLRLSTYAAWWIRRAVSDALDSARPIRIPAGAARGLAAVHRAERELRTEGSGAPTDSAVATRAGLTPERVRVLRRAARVTASLDDEVGDDGTALHELVADPGADDPWGRVDEHETRRHVWAMLKLLPSRHREVLVRRYGIVGDDAETHAEIAAHLGVGEERSRQLEHEALHRLRELGNRQPGSAVLAPSGSASVSTSRPNPTASARVSAQPGCVPSPRRSTARGPL